MLRYLGVVLILAVVGVAHGDADRVVYETEVDAGVQVVWDAFTTADGLRSWMAPLVDIDLKLGGKMRANYQPGGKLGDKSTIENTVLAYDPRRMLTLKATGFPAGFPFKDAALKTWSVFYFQPLKGERTKITIVGLGYTDEEASKKMRSFFAAANKASLDKLKAALAKRAGNQK